MSSSTTNLGLLKPDPAENWSVDNHFNANMNKIDEAFAHLIDPSAGASDLNNCKTLGFYRSSPSASNNPVSGYFAVFVVPFVGSRDIAQIATEVNTNRMFVRTLHDSSAWTAWRELADASKTIYNGTANSNYISALEGKVVKNGSFVSGYFVLTANADFTAQNLTLISNLPAAYNQDIQLPCIGLSGTNIYKASRVRITTSGNITTWYGYGFKSGEAYLISVNYICA